MTPQHDVHRSIALRDGAIVATGSGPRDFDPLISDGTRVVDDPELTLLPGFIDTHTRLICQLIRQKGRVQDGTFEIDFLDPGVEVFSFTFG